ncbi:nidogen-like domain-containing protein [Ditylenchus destructor]|uniref:Nidogen-like domain-containing protein n=1 Tax=Ditylenchus destructor TaxID=166010 RepID=A0AAD4MMC2_9BILA|nr:nidogen-like domain-containing protein [Ditylenchus destructor]
MHRLILLWCIISILKCAPVKCRVPLEDFYLFGLLHGDEKLPKGSEYVESTRFDLSDAPFFFYESLFDYVYVTSWGEIEFAAGYIIPFNAAFDTSKTGNIYVRKSTAFVDLEKAQKDVCFALPIYCDVKLLWAIISTWDHVVPRNFTYTGSNTLQAILTSDGTKTFVIFYYNRVDWFQSRFAHIKDIWTSNVGFHSPMDNETALSYSFSGSGTYQMLTLEHRSNFHVPGKWVFVVDGSAICAPDSPCDKQNATIDICDSRDHFSVMKWLVVVGCVVSVVFIAISLYLKYSNCSVESLSGHCSRANSAIRNLFPGYFHFNNDETLLV